MGHSLVVSAEEALWIIGPDQVCCQRLQIFCVGFPQVSLQIIFRTFPDMPVTIFEGAKHARPKLSCIQGFNRAAWWQRGMLADLVVGQLP